MKERIFVLTVVYGCLILYDGLHLKNNTNKREKAVYLIIIIVSLYMGFDYVTNMNLVDYYDMIEPIFGKMATKIDEFLKGPQ